MWNKLGEKSACGAEYTQLWIGDAVCQAWGGLRGSLALLLSLSLKYVFTREDQERAHQNLLLISGCVLFSIIIQGTTFPPLAREMMVGRADNRISSYRKRQKRKSVSLRLFPLFRL